jgi:hypothetical protein
MTAIPSAPPTCRLVVTTPEAHAIQIVAGKQLAVCHLHARHDPSFTQAIPASSSMSMNGVSTKLPAGTGLDQAMLTAEAVLDPAATVRADVDRLLSSPKVPPQISVSGHVYDLQTGLVTTITGPAQPQAQGSSADAPATAPAPQPS